MIEVNGNETKIDRFDIAEIIAQNFGVNIRDVSIVIENGWTVAYIKTDKAQEVKKTVDNSALDFHWDGRGSYEESRRAFYGDFS